MRVKRTIIAEVPSDVVSASNTYIEKKLGKPVSRYYIYRPDLSSYKDYLYHIVYTLQPYPSFANKLYITIVYNNGVVEDLSSTIPDCIGNPSFCDFQLTEDDLRNKIVDREHVEMKLEPPFIKFIYCANSEENKMWIDYRDKEVTFEDPQYLSNEPLPIKLQLPRCS